MASIFRWLTGKRDHHIVVTAGGGRVRWWWRIVRDDGKGQDWIDVANCPTPGFRSEEEAIADARAFLDGIDARYLDVRSGRNYLPPSQDEREA